MYYIKNKEDYYNHITRYCKTEKEKAEVITKAYEIALETRKFEIELYWKRATYFWAFIGAIFVAYFALLNADMQNNYDWLTIPVSLLGLAFSLGWYFVNKGSKLWQENWERNISFLEDYISGPIFKSLIVPNLKKAYFTKSYPYSVSKVNILLSLITVLFWTVILYISSIFYLKQIETVHFWCILIIGSFGLLLGIYWFHKKAYHLFLMI